MTTRERTDSLIITVTVATLAMLGVLVLSFLLYVPVQGWPSGGVIELGDLDGIRWLPSVALVVSFCVFPIAYERLSGTSLANYGLKLPQHPAVCLFASIVLGVLLYAVAALASMLQYGVFPRWTPDVGFGGAALMIHFLVLSFAEESLFRGFVQRRLCRVLGMVAGVGLTSVAFAFVLHASSPFASNLLYRFPGGIILGALYVRTGSLWPPLLCHWAYNSAPVLLAAIVGVQ